MQVVTKNHLENFTEKLLENDKSIRDEFSNSITTINSVINGTGEGIEKTLTGTEFDAFEGIKSNSTIRITSSSSVSVFSHGKNLLPFDIASYDSNLTTVSEDDESITVKITGGATFKHFRLSPIFLKAGTYTISRKVEKVSGDVISNAGTIYIYTGDSESSQTTTLKVFNDNSQSFILDSDKWVLIDVYANTNYPFTNDTTIKFSNFQIEKGNSFTSYEKYKGTKKTGNSLSFTYFTGIGLYSASEITAKYISVSQSSLSLEDIKEKVSEFETSILEINDKIANIGNSNSKLVVAYGDSLTNGTGSDIAKPSSDTNSNTSYPAVLNRKLGVDYTVVNAGIGGEPSWMIAARQGGMPVSILPNTIPATKTKTRVYLKGMEQDAYYDKDTSKWTYSPDTLSYNLATEDANARVNPCKICGVEGTLTRELISSGSPDPSTGETVQSNTYAYYFTRAEEGDAVTFDVPKSLITYASEHYRDAISIIWAGQNDAPKINNKYFTQIGTHNRIRQMIEHLNNNKYIVMQTPSSSNEKDIENDQLYTQEFGKHYINIRKFICDYCIPLCAKMGYTITRETSNTYVGDSTVDSTYATVGESLDAGVIPRVLRKDGVHGNYYYYQIVAIAVYERGKDLGYWN